MKGALSGALLLVRIRHRSGFSAYSNDDSEAYLTRENDQTSTLNCFVLDWGVTFQPAPSFRCHFDDLPMNNVPEEVNTALVDSVSSLDITTAEYFKSLA